MVVDDLAGGQRIGQALVERVAPRPGGRVEGVGAVGAGQRGRASGNGPRRCRRRGPSAVPEALGSPGVALATPPASVTAVSSLAEAVIVALSLVPVMVTSMS